MEDRINQAREAIKMAWKSGTLSRSMVASLCFVGPEEVSLSYSQICYASLRCTNTGVRDAVVLGIQESEKLLPVESSEIYLNWLLNDSPYSEVFIDKDARWCLRNGTVAATGHVPANLLASGLISLRRLWEFSDISRITADLIKAGMGGNLSYLLAHCIKVDGDLKRFQFSSSDCHHKAINTGIFGRSSVRNFVRGTPLKSKLRGIYSSGANYSGIDKMWGSDHSEFLLPLLKSMEGILTQTTVGNKNPFTRSKVSKGIGMSYHSLLENCKDIEKKIKGEL